VERTAEPVVEGHGAALPLIDGSGVLPSRGGIAKRAPRSATARRRALNVPSRRRPDDDEMKERRPICAIDGGAMQA